MFSSILQDFSLMIEYTKTEVFHFTWATKNPNPPALNLSMLGGPILRPKNVW